MSETVVLTKVLNVREQEKTDAQMEQIEARNSFEKVAQQLYINLKTKEQAERTLETYMEESSAINYIKDQSHYIQLINKKIMSLQLLVQEARQKMEIKQEELTEAHVEVKKIEKMIEKREEKMHIEEQKIEMMMMDEISIRQFTTQAQNR